MAEYCMDCGEKKTKRNTVQFQRSSNGRTYWKPRCKRCTREHEYWQQRLEQVDKMKPREYWKYVRDEVMA